jgi:hypothetical protein
MTDLDLKQHGWQLISDAGGNQFWRDPLHPVRTFPFDLAVKEQEKRNESENKRGLNENLYIAFNVK